MKKFFSLLLAIALVLSMAVSANAATSGKTSGGIECTASFTPKNNTGTSPDRVSGTTNSVLTTSDDYVYVEIFYSAASGSGSRSSSNTNSS